MKPELLIALARPRAGFALPSRKIFNYFSGNFSVTVKGSLTSVTQAFRFQTNLFWNATTFQTKREQRRSNVNETLRKALYPWA
jgi:hypothetical protein